MIRSTRTILIVEDDLAISRIYQGLFRMEGFEVQLAQDGIEAIDRLSDGKPDIVLLDLMLPRKNGVEVLKHIRSQAALRDLPVIVFSNAYMGTLMRDAMQAGATHCLAKSQIQPKQVIKTIVEFLAAGQPAAEAPKTDPTKSPRSDSPVTSAPATPQSEKRPENERAAGEVGCILNQLSPLVLSLRESLRAATRSAHGPERHEQLTELIRFLGSFATVAQEARLDTMAHTATILQTVAGELRAKRTDAGGSELRTLAQGVDCLAALTNRADQPPPFSKTPIVLLLDGDPISRPLTMESITNVGLHCVGLSDPQVALKVLSVNSFDLVILDGDVPSSSGLELCRQLREFRQHKKTPLLLVTSSANVQVRAQSVMCGAADFVRKPLSPTELAAKALLTLETKSAQWTRREP
jgi:DNA-binding response OmpR family regulator